jgi:uroporphyrinogen decarboxylase
LVKTEKDFELWLKYCVRGDSDYDASVLREPMEYLGQDGVACGEVGIPGLAQLAGVFEGKLAPATYFYFDHPEAIQRYREKIEKALLRKLEFTLESGVDYVQLGSSGMLTLSNLEIFRELCLPFMKKASALCRQAGKLCEVHCCGKARQVVEACYEETDVDCINPLQPPPMGDCDLAELKRLFGHRLCLKGNVGVTDPLLFGTPDAVEKDVVRCMEAAKEGGRYILFSEEGIGALTPAENVRRYVEVGKSLGKY